MIDHAYEKESDVYRQNGINAWLLEKFEDWCLDVARSLNDRSYIRQTYSWKDIKRMVKEIL